MYSSLTECHLKQIIDQIIYLSPKGMKIINSEPKSNHIITSKRKDDLALKFFPAHHGRPKELFSKTIFIEKAGNQASCSS